MKITLKVKLFTLANVNSCTYIQFTRKSIMGIEQDIQQKNFNSEYQKLIVNIAFTNNHITTMLNGYLKPHGLSMQQFNVLRILRGQHPNPVSINSITSRMIDKMSNASRLVDKLLIKQLVQRQVCKNDRRQVDVLLTTKGLETLANTDTLMQHLDLEFSHIAPQHAKNVNDILDQIRNKNERKIQ